MKNSVTKMSPHQLLFSFTPRDIMGHKLLLELHQPVYINHEEMETRRSKALERICENQVMQKKKYDSKHSKPTIYNVDDLVLVANEPQATGDSRKLQPKWRGPYIVNKVLGHDRYVIEDLPGMQRNQKRFSSVFSSDRMKQWCRLPADDEEDDDNEDVDEEDGDDEDIYSEAHQGTGGKDGTNNYDREGRQSNNTKAFDKEGCPTPDRRDADHIRLAEL